jgi:hypothetical protein
MLRIETARSADLTPILQLLRTQLEEHDIVLTGEALQRATQGLIEDHALGRILTARVDDELVGVAVISFLWTLEHGGPAAWLDEVYVEPAGAVAASASNSSKQRCRWRAIAIASRSTWRSTPATRLRNASTSAWDSGAIGGCAGCGCCHRTVMK